MLLNTQGPNCVEHCIAEIEAGTTKAFTLEEVAKEFGVKLNLYPIHTDSRIVKQRGTFTLRIPR